MVSISNHLREFPDGAAATFVCRPNQPRGVYEIGFDCCHKEPHAHALRLAPRSRKELFLPPASFRSPQSRGCCAGATGKDREKCEPGTLQWPTLLPARGRFPCCCLW